MGKEGLKEEDLKLFEILSLSELKIATRQIDVSRPNKFLKAITITITIFCC
jgi:hypothetical protein